MTRPSQTLIDDAREFIDDGDSVTVTNYTQSGTDRYGDPEFSEATVSTTGVFRQPKEPAPGDSAGGITQEFDVSIWLRDDVPVTEADDSAVRASEVTNDRTGARYRVEQVWDEGNGTVRIDGIEVRNS